MAKAGLHLSVPCDVCKRVFRQSRSNHIFCSGKCASSAWRERRRGAVQCLVCTKNVPLRRKKYCSGACLAIANAEKKKNINGPGKGWSGGAQFVPRLNCKLCGKLFYAPPVLVRRGGGKFCSNACRAKGMATNPQNFPQTRSRRGRGGKRDDLNSVYFRSSWEANWARYLNWLQRNGQIHFWEYEPDTFEFPVKRGSRFYTPDFKITETKNAIPYYQEIKGYMDQRSATKLKRMKKYYPAQRVDLIDRPAYYSVAKQVQSFIPHWEARR